MGLEVNTCNPFLAEELARLPVGAVVLTLGGIAHKAVIKALGLRQADYPFGHALEYELDNQLTVLTSYHCSRYNTQTRRLTEPMFMSVIKRARTKVDAS